MVLCSKSAKLSSTLLFPFVIANPLLPLVWLPLVNSTPFVWWAAELPFSRFVLFVLLLSIDVLLFKASNILAEPKSATKSVSGVKRFVPFWIFELGGGRWKPFCLMTVFLASLNVNPLVVPLVFEEPLRGVEMLFVNKLLLSFDDKKSAFHRPCVVSFVLPFDDQKLPLFSSIDLAVPFVKSVALFNCCFCVVTNWAVFVIDFSGLAGSK